jgi:hypothetical protein
MLSYGDLSCASCTKTSSNVYPPSPWSRLLFNHLNKTCFRLFRKSFFLRDEENSRSNEIFVGKFFVDTIIKDPQLQHSRLRGFMRAISQNSGWIL